MKENYEFIKIVYFDEQFVSDYLQMQEGGELKKTREFLSDVQSGFEASGKANAHVGAKESIITKLFGFNLGISAQAGGDISRKREHILKNTLQNTLLVDFLELLKDKNKREGIEIFEQIQAKPKENSFTCMMLMSPYFKIMDGKVDLEANNPLKMDPTKLEAALERGRGFYEFIGSNNGEKFVIRVNKNSFRNGYTMSDLPKMQLDYYAVKVGRIRPEELSVDEEFKFGIGRSVSCNFERESNDAHAEYLDVYDAVIAGVTR